MMNPLGQVVLGTLYCEGVMGTAVSAFAALEDEFMHADGITGVWYGPQWAPWDYDGLGTPY